MTDPILDLASKVYSICPTLRWGQAVFNAAAELYPIETEEVRRAGLDPFYHSDAAKVEAFVKAVHETRRDREKN